MSLKLPGVGKKITEFEYAVVQDSSGNVVVSISYNSPNGKKYKFFELRCDKVFDTLERIVETVTNSLEEAKEGGAVKISEDSNRSYILFNNHRFTGNSIPCK